VDGAFWIALRASWPDWASRPVIVNPNTVAKWLRDRYRRHWAKISHPHRRPGRPRVNAEILRLIRTIAGDGWGAPQIHGELLKLGFVVSEITVSRHMPRRPVEPDQLKRWIAFSRNHKEAIAVTDFFTVPTATLRVLYGFVVIEHGHRHVLHFNATFNPAAASVIQQVREAFPHDTAPKDLIFDRDSIFSAEMYNPSLVRNPTSLGHYQASNSISPAVDLRRLRQWQRYVRKCLPQPSIFGHQWNVQLPGKRHELSVVGANRGCHRQIQSCGLGNLSLTRANCIDRTGPQLSCVCTVCATAPGEGR